MESIAADLQEFKLGNQILKIWVPNFQALQASHQLNAYGDAPFWGRAWPSALAMIQYLEANPAYIKDKKLVEIAAGLGLPAFYASQFASETIVSDYAEDAVQWMEKNIELNQLDNIAAKQINWHQLPTDLQADTLLLCDVNYDPNQFHALLKMIHLFLAKGTTILLTTPQRLVGRSFISSFLEHVVINEVLEIQQDEKLHLINVLVLVH
jgi:predicted nicotinamide N-methyase